MLRGTARFLQLKLAGSENAAKFKQKLLDKVEEGNQLLMKKRIRILAVLLALVLVAALMTACGKQESKAPAAGKTITLKFYWTTVDGEKDPYAISARTFKELVEKKTQGKVDVKLFPNSQLGGERDAIEGISLGTIDMGVITNAPISGFVPQFQILDLPFIFKDSAQAYKVLDGPFGQSLLKRLETRGIKGLGFSEGGFRHMLNNVRPIKTPDDVKGVKFRVMESPTYIGMFKALGSNPTPMAWGETFTAVQQKTIDGLEIPIPVIYQNKYFEVTKYLSLTNHTYSPLIFMISMKTWDKLPPDIQKAIVDSVKEAIPVQRSKNTQNINELLGELKAKGMAVNNVDNPEAFKEKVKPMYKEFEAKIGKDVMDAFFAVTQ